ncbi:MAG TPA: hypothetical protein VFW77_00635 [Candidatus Saccharimonadales bacterium]|nr:hypothetical protein [Candidatus Saccharimonadales bacterium]
MPQTLAPPPAPSPEQEPHMLPPSTPVEAELVAMAVEPTVEQIPETPKDTSPVQFMGGMLYDQEKNGNTLNYIESTGRPTLPPLPSRRTKGAPWRNRIHSSSQGEEVVIAPKALLRTTDEEVKAITSLAQEARADEVIAEIESQPERVTLIGQSADAQPALIAVHKQPDKFKNLILAFPSGVIKKRHRSEYMRQAASDIGGRRDEPIFKVVVEPENNFDVQMPDSASETGRLMMRRFKGSGGLRALSSTMSGYQGGLLHEVRQNEDAPAVSMVLGTKDRVGKPDRILESLKSADDVDFLLIVNSTHGIQGRKDLMDKILELTDIMGAQSQKRKEAKAKGERFDPGSLADRLIFLDEDDYRVPEEEQERLKELARQVPIE